MSRVIPTILTTDLEEIKEKLVRLQGLVDWIHLDIMDGRFVANKTAQLKDLAGLKRLKKFKIGAHLMVKNPIKLVDQAKKLGIKRLVGQIEMMADQQEFIQTVKAKKMTAGLALDLETKIKEIKPRLLNKIEFVLLMMVKAGWGGQKLQKKRLEELKRLKQIKEKNNFNFQIAVDGGVNFQTIKSCQKAGAEIFAVGSAVWKSKNIGKAIRELNKLATGKNGS